MAKLERIKGERSKLERVQSPAVKSENRLALCERLKAQVKRESQPATRVGTPALLDRLKLRLGVQGSAKKEAAAPRLAIKSDPTRVKAEVAVAGARSIDVATAASIKRQYSVKAERKPVKKPAKKRKKGTGKRRKKKHVQSDLQKEAFQRPIPLSAQLQAVLGCAAASRQDCVRGIWAYVREKNLKNPDDGREILCDAKLRAVFGQPRVSMFQVTGGLTPHLLYSEELGPDSPSRAGGGDSDPEADYDEGESSDWDLGGPPEQTGTEEEQTAPAPAAVEPVGSISLKNVRRATAEVKVAFQLSGGFTAGAVCRRVGGVKSEELEEFYVPLTIGCEESAVHTGEMVTTGIGDLSSLPAAFSFEIGVQVFQSTSVKSEQVKGERVKEERVRQLALPGPAAGSSKIERNGGTTSVKLENGSSTPTAANQLHSSRTIVLPQRINMEVWSVDEAAVVVESWNVGSEVGRSLREYEVDGATLAQFVDEDFKMMVAVG
mmetsp:Transcript_115671/g.265580  ORF Transcript_115671/g.265580 Transcript_115671/m.265580 type:complete len:491 (+) Transcript_115671:31-1503(+)